MRSLYQKLAGRCFVENSEDPTPATPMFRTAQRLGAAPCSRRPWRAAISRRRGHAACRFPIGYSSNGGTYGSIGLIQQQRLLEQQGIRAQFVYIGGPQITQAFVAGDMQMMIVAAASPIRAAAQGAEVKFVGGVMDKEVLTLITSPEIKSPAHMKGAKLAIDRLGDYTEFLGARGGREAEPYARERCRLDSDRRSNLAFCRAEERRGAGDLCRAAIDSSRETSGAEFIGRSGKPRNPLLRRLLRGAAQHSAAARQRSL